MVQEVGINSKPMIMMKPDEFKRMKNCVNCDHFEVCVVVHDRRRRQAGDYSPCGKWKLVSEK